MKRHLQHSTTARISTALHLLLLLWAAVAGLYIVFIDLIEMSNRALGSGTYFAQRSWLSDTQVIVYCMVWIMLFGIALILLAYTIYRRQKKSSIIIALIIYALFIASIFVEPMFYDKLP